METLIDKYQQDLQGLTQSYEQLTVSKKIKQKAKRKGWVIELKSMNSILAGQSDY